MFLEVVTEPIPKPKPGRPPTGPCRTMKVGDSFLYRGDKPENGYHVATRANRALAPKRFSARKTKDGVRIWRVK